jgi:hypothetical protein
MHFPSIGFMSGFEQANVTVFVAGYVQVIVFVPPPDTLAVPPFDSHSALAVLVSVPAGFCVDVVHVFGSPVGVGVFQNTFAHVNVVVSFAGASHFPLSNVAPGSSLHAFSEPCSL